jgi:predicted kinase
MNSRHTHPPVVTRREFARTAIRMVWLGGMVVLGATLARRACRARGPCQNCTLFAECALPWRKAKS